MCGRFENKLSVQEISRLLGALQLPFNELKTKPFNIAPTENIQALMNEDKGIVLSAGRWGIKFSADSPLIFNTRIETIKEKGFWKKLYENNRCLVPMTGFYEWKKSGSKKIPHRIYLPDTPLFFVAGLYSNNKEKGKEISLVTTVPNKFISKIHHRMPVIVAPEKMEAFFSATLEENISNSLPLSDDIIMEMEPAEI